MSENLNIKTFISIQCLSLFINAVYVYKKWQKTIERAQNFWGREGGGDYFFDRSKAQEIKTHLLRFKIKIV